MTYIKNILHTILHRIVAIKSNSIKKFASKLKIVDCIAKILTPLDYFLRQSKLLFSFAAIKCPNLQDNAKCHVLVIRGKVAYTYK